MSEKRDFTADERAELEESGMAMPGGGYPIETVGDLRNAIQAIGRAKDREATILHIIEQARRLERLDLIPEDWFEEVDEEKADRTLVDVPQWIADNAKQGLKWRDDTNYRGGVMDYVIREAQDMADGKVTVDKAKRMYAWFARHMVDLDSPAADPDSEDYPSPGVVAHALWGGRNREDSKRAMEWAKKIRDQYEDEKQETEVVEWKSTGVVEHKTVPVCGVKVLDEDSGLVETIVSVTGIVDRVKDVIEPGAYQKTLAERTPKGVWGHDWNTPISRTEEVVELMPGDPRLPIADRKGDSWPSDAGALLVRTRFNLETQRGREAFSDVKFFGDQQEWSIGYNVPVGGAKVESKTGIRRIQSLDLFEYSPVLFGAMPEAVTQSVKTAQNALKAVRAVELTEHEVIDEVAQWFDDAREEIEAEIAEFEAAQSTVTASEPEDDEDVDGFDEVSADEGELVPAVAEEKGVPGRGNAETLRRYWAEGEGALKIRWGQPGDFDRCVRAVNQYMPGRAEGYCNLLHHRALGIWPAQHAGLEKSDEAQQMIERRLEGFVRDDEDDEMEEPKVYKPGAASILSQIADKLEEGDVDESLLRSAMSAIERLMDAQPMEEETEQKEMGCDKPPCANYDEKLMQCKVCGYSEKEDITPEVMRAEILALELDAEEKGVQEPQKHGGWIWQGNPAGAAGSPSMPSAPDVPGVTDPKAPSSSAEAPSAGAPDTKVRDAKDFSVGSAAGELKKISREGRPDASGTEADPIDVGDDVELAHKLLSEGKHVRMKDEAAVSTLLDKLHETVKDAEAKGEDAPEYDLCKVSVPGTNLFCVESKGIPRIKMPQFKGKPVPGSFADTKKNDEGEGDVEPEFRELLKELGISTEMKTVKANELRASQDNLDGVKVTGMAQAMREGKIPDSPIFVTKDGYILDGHHRWAAKVAVDLDDGESGDIEMPVEVIDAEIGYLIDLANGFTEMAGIKPKGLGASSDSVDADVDDVSSLSDDELRYRASESMNTDVQMRATEELRNRGIADLPSMSDEDLDEYSEESMNTDLQSQARDEMQSRGRVDYSSMSDQDLMDIVREAQQSRQGFRNPDTTRAVAEALRRGLLDEDIDATSRRSLPERQMDEGIRNIEESGDYAPMAGDVINGRYKLTEAAGQVSRWIDNDPDFVQSEELFSKLDEITEDRGNGEEANLDNLTADEAMDLSSWMRSRGKTGVADLVQEWAMQESDREGSMETPFGQPAPSPGRRESSSPFQAAYAAAFEFGMDDYDPNSPTIDQIVEDFRDKYPNPTSMQLQQLIRDLERIGASASADAVRRWVDQMGEKSASAELTKNVLDYMRMVSK